MVELSPGASVALGVIVGLVSTSVQSIGLTLQRKSHLLEEEKEDDYERRPAYKRRRWQLGMGMFIIANLVGSTIQITTLPLPVLSTLQASGLVFNSICASIILSEPFTRYSLVGTILVATGAVLIGIFGAIPEPSHNLDQLLQLLGRRQFVLWMAGTAVMVVSLLVANWALKRVYPRTTPKLRLVRGMLFGCVSGILSAHSLLIAKSAVELLVRTIIDRHNEFNRWQSWMILLGLVAFALTQLYYMHRGLKLCSTSVLYPLVFCVYNIIAILDGLIYFHQSSRLSSLQAGLIALGTLILLGGVISLSWRLEDNDEEASSPKHHRVAPPQNMLTPGIALVNSSVDDESESAIDIDELEPGVHGALADHHIRQSADERTPLLARSPTGPAVFVDPRSKKRPSLITTGLKAGPRPSASPRRPPRRRRMTVSQETNEIWNELNDRDNLPSPGPRRSPDLDRRPRAGTMPARRHNSGSTWLTHARRRSLWDVVGIGGRRSSYNSASPDNRPAESHALHEQQHHDDAARAGDNDSDVDAVLNQGSNQSNEAEAGDWLKMKWWRKRWRDRDEETRGGDVLT